MRKGLLLGLSCLFLYPACCLAQMPLADALPVFPSQAVAPLTQEPRSDQPFFDDLAADSWPRVWANSEFLLWWTKKVPVSTPLWTEATNPATVFIPAGSGSLASPDTTVLLGGQGYTLGQRYGG